MSNSALFIFTDGLEELEAIAPLDILRRAGVTCVTASQTSNLEVKGRNNIRIKADCLLEEVLNQPFDLIVLPGGPGVASLRADPRVINRIKAQVKSNKLLAAICAAPTVLFEAGLLSGKSFTGHFSIAEELPEMITDQAVVVDGSIITSRGAGTAVEFGLRLAEILTGSEKTREVADSIHYLPETLPH